LSVLSRVLSGTEAVTDPDAEDARLRGRTYTIPFAQVWDAALFLVDGGLARWILVGSDDVKGVIDAERTTFFTRRVSDVRIDVGLDHNGQTRVDVHARSRGERGDLGANARAIGVLLRRMDKHLQAGPAHVLDAAGGS